VFKPLPVIVLLAVDNQLLRETRWSGPSSVSGEPSSIIVRAFTMFRNASVIAVADATPLLTTRTIN